MKNIPIYYEFQNQDKKIRSDNILNVFAIPNNKSSLDDVQVKDILSSFPLNKVINRNIHFRFKTIMNDADPKLTAWVDISNINAKVPIINNAVYMKLLILPDDVKPKQVKQQTSNEPNKFQKNVDQQADFNIGTQNVNSQKSNIQKTNQDLFEFDPSNINKDQINDKSGFQSKNLMEFSDYNYSKKQQESNMNQKHQYNQNGDIVNESLKKSSSQQQPQKKNIYNGGDLMDGVTTHTFSQQEQDQIEQQVKTKVLF